MPSAKPNKDQNLSLDSASSEGFGSLWDASYEEAAEFLAKRKKNQGKSPELKLLQEELKQRDFEIQKLKWQLGEREKELKISYQELAEQMMLNDKLNEQLEKYQKLLKIIG